MSKELSRNDQPLEKSISVNKLTFYNLNETINSALRPNKLSLFDIFNGGGSCQLHNNEQLLVKVAYDAGDALRAT